MAQSKAPASRVALAVADVRPLGCVLRWAGCLYASRWKRTRLCIPSRDERQRRAVVGFPRWLVRFVHAVALAVADAPRLAWGTRGGDPASIALDVQLENRRMMHQAIDSGECHCGITKHLVMPQCLTGESLKCGWLIRTILFMASAFRSAVAARDGDRG